MPKTKSAAALKIGGRVRAVRRKLGISLEDLGQLSEISWTNIGKIERGDSSPTAESLVRLATALEVDPGIFLSGITADDYGRRSHRFTVGDLIRGRDRAARAAGADVASAGGGQTDDVGSADGGAQAG
ncbi:helix-turn-helix domain-containing protein [Leucobacter sp. HY1908]